MNDNLKTCGVCGATMYHLNPLTGLIFEHSSCNTCWQRERVAAAEQERQIVKQRFLKNIEMHMMRRGHPERQLNSVLASGLPEPVKRRANEKRLPCFIGEAGVGKTFQAVQIAVAIASQLEPVPLAWDQSLFSIPETSIPLFLSAPDLAVRLRSTFGQRGSGLTEQGLLDYYSRTAVLVIDDLGAESIGEYSLATVYALINSRYAGSLRTVITTNLRLQELAERIGDRCVSRICEMCEVCNVEGEDRRLKGLRL